MLTNVVRSTFGTTSVKDQRVPTLEVWSGSRVLFWALFSSSRFCVYAYYNSCSVVPVVFSVSGDMLDSSFSWCCDAVGELGAGENMVAPFLLNSLVSLASCASAVFVASSKLYSGSVRRRWKKWSCGLGVVFAGHAAPFVMFTSTFGICSDDGFCSSPLTVTYFVLASCLQLHLYCVIYNLCSIVV